MTRVVNLTLHGIGTPHRALSPAEQSYWLDQRQFETLLTVIAGREDVALTFDDGNLSDVSIALPALVARKMTAAFFLLAGKLDSPGYVGAKEIAELQAAGMTLGSHGFGHRSWRKLGPVDLQEEIVTAKDRLEQAVGHRLASAACPFGEYDRRALSMLRQAGFERVYSSDGGSAERDAWFQVRNTIRVESSVFEDKALPTAMLDRPGLWRRLQLQLKRWR